MFLLIRPQFFLILPIYLRTDAHCSILRRCVLELGRWNIRSCNDPNLNKKLQSSAFQLKHGNQLGNTRARTPSRSLRSNPQGPDRIRHRQAVSSAGPGPKWRMSCGSGRYPRTGVQWCDACTAAERLKKSDILQLQYYSTGR
ncbi:hypothetical protein B0H15DRAFT_335558 [Mycena belliarum]|uniref:Uncharacterized protein n=1 Tax=Mycena belliarum TaxID=1033014 RepID=A0AAD6UHG7_9AGAR|nr:hypothetical protein B0H15DRAFT_335558 [Mycena belliae]